MSFNKDPFKPLIYIVAVFIVGYFTYCVVYKEEFFTEATATPEYKSSGHDGIKEVGVASTLNRNKRSHDFGDSDRRPLLILILASNVRSGSTLLAELLSTKENSVLFFEPFWPYRDKLDVISGDKRASDFLTNVLTCDYSYEFGTFLKEVSPFNQYFHSSIPECLSEPVPLECLEKLDLRSMCQEARVRIAKVVRMRLSWVESLLYRSSELNVKVIHLTRDPRGSITSMQSLFWNWKPSTKCGRLWEDMESYERLNKWHPNSLINVTYEELSIDPKGTMERLSNFLYNRKNLSADTELYIKKHMSDSKFMEDPLSTYRVGKDSFQSWRWKINGRLLKEIEAEPTCRLAIEKYGHNLFGTLDRVTDPRIPLRKSKGSNNEELDPYSEQE